MPDAVEARLKQIAEQAIQQIGDDVQKLFAELNATRLDGKGKITDAEIQMHHVRWGLEWKENAITFKIRVAVRLVDDGVAARVDQVLVQKEAWTPYDFEGHTPTTTMKQIATMDANKIRDAVDALWGK
ncbi:MAG: hypothetical protein HY257_02820 [Chloroflexi bacterium]|nr:hypothetical protein [Chloroflexota bacterium]